MKRFLLSTIFAIVAGLLLVAHAPYFAGETGPGTVACGYSRIGRAITVMVGGSGRTFDFDRATAADPNCHQ